MAVIIEAVEVHDGTEAPSRDAVFAAEERGEADRLKPQDTGYRHAIGKPRTITRYRWSSTVSGKSSGRGTFPNEASARAEGERHEKMTRVRVS
jgi:hypothetical protein